MTQEFELTQREFARALRYQALRNRGLAIMAVAGPVLLVGAIVAHSSLTIIIGGSLMASTAWMWFGAAGLQWRRNPLLGASQQYTFDEDHIVVVTPKSRAEIPWDYYPTIVERDDYYLLLTVQRFFTVVPRRVFASPADEAGFRALVCRQRDAGAVRS